MIKIPQKHSTAYLVTIATIYVALIVSILVLAAISESVGFWITAVLMDLIIIAMGVRFFYKLFRPKIVAKPLKDVLEFEDTSRTKTEQFSIVEKDE